MWVRNFFLRQVTGRINSKGHSLFIMFVLLLTYSLYTSIPGRKLARPREYSSIIDNNIRSTDKGNLTELERKNYTKTDIQENISRETLVKEYIPHVKVDTVSCSAIIYNNRQEITKGIRVRTKLNIRLSCYYYKNATKDCSRFVKHRQYTMQPLSDEEASFPIAYSLLVYQNVEQMERLLRAIYRPQNYYCIHTDGRAPTEFREAVKSIADCFPNVFLASKLVSVYWGSSSVLEPELICMNDLWRFKAWRYFINLTGQEFPLQTNGEIVQILKAMDGANIIEGTTRIEPRRVREPPQNSSLASVKQIKGSVHIAAQRGFVDYVLHNETALRLRRWMLASRLPMPEEALFSTLSHNPQLKVPGSYLGSLESTILNGTSVYPYLGRYVNWGDTKCYGWRVRGVCVFGVGDIPLLATRKELFLNKFNIEHQPVAFDCMEELHYNKTRDSVLGLRTFNVTFYQNLDLVKNHIN